MTNLWRTLQLNEFVIGFHRVIDRDSGSEWEPFASKRNINPLLEKAIFVLSSKYQWVLNFADFLSSEIATQESTVNTKPHNNLTPFLTK